MAQPSYPMRGAPSGRFPDRTLASSSQQQFGQSAPGFGRQAQFPPQPQQQPPYGPYSQYESGGGFGARRGQMQNQTGGVGMGMEKESNVVNALTPEQKDEIQEAFTLFDMNHDHHLDFHEFKTALRALGFKLENPEVAQLMSANGVPKSNPQGVYIAGRGQQPTHPSQLLVTYQSFLKVAAQKMDERDPNEEVERAFYLFDADRKDFISIDDLRRVTRELGETSLEEHELTTMIDEFDYEGMGGISKAAFFSICLQ